MFAKLLVLACCLVVAAANARTSRMPVIGILTMPLTPEQDDENLSFIDTSYVKFLHGGGATVVPILFNSTQTEIEEQMKTMDGVFFTGGMAMPDSFPRYFATATLLYDLVIEQGKTLWGTCLGFQMINDIGAQESILGEYPQMNVPLSLNLTDYGDKQSKLYSHLNKDMKALFTENSFTENWHSYGVGLDTFQRHMEPAGFKAVSTNIDTNGLEFVSTLEHTKHKIYGTQWHPEANQYDPDPKGTSHIVHSTAATTAMNYMAEFIIQQAVLSKTADAGASTSGAKDHMLQGHQSCLSNAIELYPVRAVVTEEDTAFHYVFA